MKSSKTLAKILIPSLIIVLLLGAGCLFYLSSMGKPYDSENAASISVEIPSGSSAAGIAKTLEDKGIIDSAGKFRIWSKSQGWDSKYKAGTYALSPSMDYTEIAEILVGGKVVTRNFTIPEGYTIYQTAQALSDQGIGSYDSFVRLTEEKNLLASYDFAADLIVQDNQNRLEGYLMPNTYNVDEGMDEEGILRVMLSQFDKTAYQEYLAQKSQNDSNLPAGRYSLSEIVTVASIIERECARDEERPLVASVIYNRLNKGMHLQMCSTVQYVLGKQKEVLTIADTKTESPYNTYLYPGLPPGPICSPGIASIHAALNPAETDYLYFVLSEKLDGTSNFSSDYNKFLKDKAAYDKAYTAAH